MALGGALSRRTGKLESLPRPCSIDDKWSSIQAAALHSMSEEDQQHWTAIQANGDDGEFTNQTEAVTDRYNEAHVDAAISSGRFTIAELDDFLAAG